MDYKVDDHVWLRSFHRGVPSAGIAEEEPTKGIVSKILTDGRVEVATFRNGNFIVSLDCIQPMIDPKEPKPTKAWIE